MTFALDFSVLRPYAGDLLAGVLTTAWMSALTVVLSMALALPGVAARVAPSRWLRLVTRGYVDLMRNVPILVLLYALFFGLGASGWQISSFMAAVAALTLNATAYVIEIYRGGIEGIPRGQREAAAALGLGPVATWRLVILPQALRIAYPALGNQVVGIVLGSSLAMVISAHDLTFAAFSIGAETFRYFETFIVAAIAYVIVVQLINLAWRLLGRALIPTYRT
jgi:His/Glu/Gln/Arg/opine family amino acid ABC transporter permease subunit